MAERHIVTALNYGIPPRPRGRRRKADVPDDRREMDVQQPRGGVAEPFRSWDEVARLFTERTGERMDAHWARALHYQALQKLRSWPGLHEALGAELWAS